MLRLLTLRALEPICTLQSSACITGILNSTCIAPLPDDRAFSSRSSPSASAPSSVPFLPQNRWRAFSTRGLREAKQETASQTADDEPTPDDILHNAPSLRVVFEDGTHRTMATAEARALAEKGNFDLLVVNARSSPAVARLLPKKAPSKDTAKEIREKKDAARRAELEKGRAAHVKEVRIRARIDPHDLATKTAQATRMLEKGYRVKVVVEWAPKDTKDPLTGPGKADSLARQVAESLRAVGRMERPPTRQGNAFNLNVSPLLLMKQEAEGVE